MRRIVSSFLMTLGLALPAAAQKGATITGLVKDSLNRPVTNAEVVARPGGRRTRSDSAGRFTLTELDGGNYTVGARKFGYNPVSWDVHLEKNGRTDITLDLGNPLPQLDTVRVTATRECPPRTLDGFVCHRRNGGGLFLDYTDIDDKEPLYTADIFRDIKGFRVEARYNRRTSTPMYVPVVVTGPGCMISIVDGMEASIANPIPDIPQNISAMEIYFKKDSVPQEYVRYTNKRPCVVVAYWTIWARTSR